MGKDIGTLEFSREDSNFRNAVLAVVKGDVEQLRDLLDEQPALVSQRSNCNHRATLLHYLAANGVEGQLGPGTLYQRLNDREGNDSELANLRKLACEVADVLLQAGADVNALCDVYDSQWTTLDLLVSSAHPFTAGVQADLVHVLCRGGAAVNGINNDRCPLGTAVAWTYTEAAEALVACGARVDNIFFAAALGQLDMVKAYFNEDGKLKLIDNREISWLEIDEEQVADIAMIYAAAHGRIDVVRYLLTRDVDLTVEDPLHGGTAIGFAEGWEYREIVELLRQHGKDD